MHQPADNSIRTRRRALRVGVLGALVVLAFVQVAARSGVVMRAPIESGLSALGHDLNGRFSVGSIRPAGLWSMRLGDVVFRPHLVPPIGGDQPLIRIDSVEVRPHVAALLAGKPGIEAIDFHGLSVNAVADSGGGPHVEWFRWLVRDIGRREPAGGGDAPLRTTPAGLPVVAIHDGAITVTDPSGRFPGLAATIESIAIAPPADGGPGRLTGEVTIDGLGAGDVVGAFGTAERRLSLRLREPSDLFPLLPFDIGTAPDAQLSIAAVHVDWPPRVVLSQVAGSALGIEIPAAPDRTVDAVTAETVAVGFDRSGMTLRADRVLAGLSGAVDATLPIHSAVVRRPWREPRTDGVVELLDEAGNRAAITFAVNGSSDARARASAERFALETVAPIIDDDAPARPTAGTFTGTAAVAWTAEDDAITVELGGSFEDLGIASPIVSATPLTGLRLETDATASARRVDGSFVVDHARVLLPDIGLYVHGRASRDHDHSTLRLDATLPRAPAQALFDALPVAVTDALTGLRLAGEIGGRVHLAFDTADLAALEFDAELDTDAFGVISFGPLSPVPALALPDFVWTTSGATGRTRSVGPGDPSWFPLDGIPALTWRAVIAAEDDRFWMHHGVDVRAIGESLRANIEAGRIVRGASTISQQVAKNLFLDDSRTIARKVQEAFLAWQIEERLSKEQILEYYLNLAHWGPEIFGLRQAALAYFDHTPTQLTLRESAFLAAILPNPILFGEQYTEGVVPPSRRTKMRHILANLYRGGYLSEATMLYHVGLVDRGRVSATPPPAELGVHDRDARSPHTVDRIGFLVLPPDAR